MFLPFPLNDRRRWADKWLKYFSDFVLFISLSSLEGRITDSVKQLGDLLLAVKGQGNINLSQPATRNQVAAEADEVLRPLMDLLDGMLYAFLF